ncbi:MAG: AAA family ATPase [Paracoccaceae bacterium]|nr:AAA family ATPase [Paracoccaceae bacterium]
MEDVTLKGFDLRPAQEVKRQPEKPQVKPGKIYTFYSFKGGVGRSMAMANVAVSLAVQGNKVLMIGFDLEAPGLEHFFFSHDPTLQDRLRSGSGLIDLLTPKSMDLRSVVTKVNLDLEALSFAVNEPNDGARLDIIQSGRASRAANDYTQLVQNLNLDDLYTKHDIGNRFGAYRGEWLAKYDYVLIDSRSGMTDSGDLCTVVLVYVRTALRRP